MVAARSSLAGGGTLYKCVVVLVGVVVQEEDALLLVDVDVNVDEVNAKATMPELLLLEI